MWDKLKLFNITTSAFTSVFTFTSTSTSTSVSATSTSTSTSTSTIFTYTSTSAIAVSTVTVIGTISDTAIKVPKIVTNTVISEPTVVNISATIIPANNTNITMSVMELQQGRLITTSEQPQVLLLSTSSTISIVTKVITTN